MFFDSLKGLVYKSHLFMNQSHPVALAIDSVVHLRVKGICLCELYHSYLYSYRTQCEWALMNMWKLIKPKVFVLLLIFLWDTFPTLFIIVYASRHWAEPNTTQTYIYNVLVPYIYHVMACSVSPVPLCPSHFRRPGKCLPNVYWQNYHNKSRPTSDI